MSTKNLLWSVALALGLAGSLLQAASAAEKKPAESKVNGAAVNGWLDWRGPHQNGTSDEKHLPEKWEVGGANHLFTLDIRGRGTPVVSGNRVYAWGYIGDGPDMRETLVCLDAESGKVQWQKFFNDYLSDVVYDRYTLGAPTIDPETGNVYLLTTAGDFYCFTADGKEVWKQAMLERFGRLTFPSARTGAPSIDGPLVIVHSVSANWGGEGPARDRFYAFDKASGEPVWGTSPGIGAPYLKDNSFASAVFAWDAEGRRVFYSTTGDGTLSCINVNTGQAIWRAQLAVGGINATPVIYKDTIITAHGVLDIITQKNGGMYALKLGAKPKPIVAGEEGAAPALDTKEATAWFNPSINMFTASPTLVGDRIYQMDQSGNLWCVDAATGKALWEKKLAPDQIHASMTWGDGKLYIPVNSGGSNTNNSLFYILRPSDKGVEVLAKVEVEGNCLGAPAIWNGKVYFFTNQKLYAFGHKGQAKDLPTWPKREQRPAGKAAALLAVPYDVLLTPGKSQKVELIAIDDKGLRVGKVEKATWAKYVPPTAKVKAEMDAHFEGNTIMAAANAKPSAGAFQATTPDGLKGVIRGRVMSNLPMKVDFESTELNQDHEGDKAKYAYPPLPWIGARFKWEIRDVQGNKALAKTLDSLLFQRALTFIGPDDLSNYTLEADVMTEGGRRGSSEVGVINQRYIIQLLGNAQTLEVNSNHERIKVSVPFKWQAGTWYHLKTRVDVNPDGSGVVRAKAWQKGESEPEKWTIEVPHKNAHTHGAPGVFGFAPQNKFRCYVDNITVTSNK